jgi:hypothetical protein
MISVYLQITGTGQNGLLLRTEGDSKSFSDLQAEKFVVQSCCSSPTSSSTECLSLNLSTRRILAAEKQRPLCLLFACFCLGLHRWHKQIVASSVNYMIVSAILCNKLMSIFLRLQYRYVPLISVITSISK